ALARASEADDLPGFLGEVPATAREGLAPDPDAVVLSTIHRAKGLEFPVVLVVGLAEGLLPHARSLGDPPQLAEELRLAYVALTRAMDRLYLTVPLLGERGGRTFPREPSRFLEVLPRHLL